MADDGGASPNGPVDTSGPADTSGGGGPGDEPDGLGPGSGMLLHLLAAAVLLAAGYLLYRRLGRRLGAAAARDGQAAALPKMRRRDFSVEQLAEYDGLRNPRILMAVNMKVFDVTTGKKFYGKGNGNGEKR
ncbi:Membrane-associated progesterone receptor component 2 [Merluccius polli]|uniref:Membrane-associated progesterone receptor component 2 n=1 Tax=Merluccius polli TaxID=89951 RepID=A0AA47P0T6_MERPO|nr:Membrane-associated progesterone receptor component 2 [Merluccius polli]